MRPSHNFWQALHTTDLRCIMKVEKQVHLSHSFSNGSYLLITMLGHHISVQKNTTITVTVSLIKPLFLSVSTLHESSHCHDVLCRINALSQPTKPSLLFLHLNDGNSVSQSQSHFLASPNNHLHCHSSSNQ